MRATLFAVLLGIATVAGCKSSDSKPADKAEKEEALQSLSVDEVATKLAAKDGKTFIYDNNDQQQYAVAHVPGAKWVDEDSVTAAVLPADKAATLIFYCHSET